MVRWDCCGIGGALQVFSRVLVMLLMSVSRKRHAFSHGVSDSLLLFVKMEVKESMRFVFSSKKCVVI